MTERYIKIIFICIYSYTAITESLGTNTFLGYREDESTNRSYNNLYMQILKKINIFCKYTELCIWYNIHLYFNIKMYEFKFKFTKCIILENIGTYYLFIIKKKIFF